MKSAGVHRGDMDLLMRYLLGALPEEEAQGVEREYFGGADSFEALMAAEDDLYFLYAEGGLVPEDRRRFEDRFLRTDDDRRRLARTRLLLKGVPAPRRAIPSAAWLAAAAAVVLLAASLWLVRQPVHDPGRSITGTEGEHPVPRTDAEIVVVTVSRDAEPPRVYLPASAKTLRIEVRMEARGNGPWRASLHSSDGPTVWTGEGAAVSGGLRLDVPAAALVEDEYEVRIEGPEGAVSHPFLVLRD